MLDVNVSFSDFGAPEICDKTMLEFSDGPPSNIVTKSWFSSVSNESKTS